MTLRQYLTSRPSFSLKL